MDTTNQSWRSMFLSLPASPLLRAYVAAVGVAGAAAVVLGVVLGSGSGDAGLIAGLVIAGAISERWKVGLFGDAHVSLSGAVLMAAALAGGPRDVAIVAPLLAVAVNLGGVVPLYKTVFNASVYTLAPVAFLATVSVFDPNPQANDWLHLVVPAALGAGAYFALNAVLVATAVSMASGQQVVDVIRRKYLWLLPNYLPLGAIAAAFLFGYASAGVGAILIFALPAAGVQAALSLYSTLKRTSDVQLRDVQERIKAVEAELALAHRLEVSAASRPHVA